MRDDEIEAVLCSVRPRGLSEADRRQVIKSILEAGGVRSFAWWERPVALWKAAAAVALAASAFWGSSWLRAGTNPREGEPLRLEREPFVAASIVRRTFAQVEPAVFRGGDGALSHDSDCRTWRVLDQRVDGQTSEEAR